jgi:hypothetical protein
MAVYALLMFISMPFQGPASQTASRHGDLRSVSWREKNPHAPIPTIHTPTSEMGGMVSKIASSTTTTITNQPTFSIPLLYRGGIIRPLLMQRLQFCHVFGSCALSHQLRVHPVLNESSKVTPKYSLPTYPLRHGPCKKPASPAPSLPHRILNRARAQETAHWLCAFGYRRPASADFCPGLALSLLPAACAVSIMPLTASAATLGRCSTSCTPRPAAA